MEKLEKYLQNDIWSKYKYVDTVINTTHIWKFSHDQNRKIQVTKQKIQFKLSEHLSLI